MAFVLRLALLALLYWNPAWCDGLIPPLTEKQVLEARKILAGFKASPKGPFLRIRWFCQDGSILPPAGTPCRERGGGNQHAELTAEAKKLAEWNLHTGTILTGLAFEELLDGARDHHWLKELVLEKYLVEVNDGWVYRKAFSYRGARQVEDEERAGRRFLIQLLSDPDWLGRNFFLAMQLVDTLPHGVADSTVKRTRGLASVVADRDPRFQRIRAKIHSYPGPEDAAAVREFLNNGKPAEPVKQHLEELATLLEKQYSRQSWVPLLRAAQKNAANTPVHAAIEELIHALESYREDSLLAKVAGVSVAIRTQASQSKDGRQNLSLLDLNRLLQEKAFELKKPAPDVSRAGLLTNLQAHLGMATGAGLLSFRQLEAMNQEIASLEKRSPLPAGHYRASIRYLGRAAEWCRATAAKDFGPVSMHYQAVEPAAKALVDHLLRSSAALPLSNRLEVLLADADSAAGIRHSVFGSSAGAGVVGLNPGVAIGKLGIIEEGKEESSDIDPRGIYVIPQTASDIKPMAGILSLDAGNMLSHAQLLAANLGIPNARIPSRLLSDLEKHKGEEMFYAVTPRSVVVLKKKSALDEDEKKIWGNQPAATVKRIDVDANRLNLTEKRLLLLTEVGSKDSGVTVGPKAANLGQLAGYFPREVAPGIVIPFGIFHDHISRVLDDSGTPLIEQIKAAVTRAEQMRESGASPQAVSAFIYPKLAHFRAVIQKMTLLEGFQKDLVRKMEETFGADGSYGVFVRSDTNAEDLPGFTGAGLNLTVPNQVGSRNILNSIRNVWASPYTERAYDWRSRALKGTENVYPSVIVMRAVPSDKSGVIVTVDLETGRDDLTTVNVSEGVSAVVDGGVAESLLLSADGEVKLLQQCRATYRKICKPEGGFQNIPATGGDAVLTREEIAQLRQMVAEVKRKYPPMKSEAGMVLPWDIEFGFEKGALRLFQIRPLARFQEWKVLEALSRLEGPSQAERRVRLEENPMP